MIGRRLQAPDGVKRRVAVGVGVLVLAAVGIGYLEAPVARAQDGGRPAAAPAQFEVASVKQNRTDGPPNSNFPLGPGDVYVRNGGYLAATGFPLTTYIAFAYRAIGNQGQFLAEQLPDWAKTERFDIEARAQGDPGKDGMRAMMRSLLADRFKLAIRYEEREVPVFACVLVKSGKLGPQLRPHSEGSPCPTEPPTPSTPTVVDGLPAFCNGIYPLPPSAPGHLRFGGRNVTIGFIADTFGSGALGRPMIDKTGLSGTFDFTLEWMPERRVTGPSGVDEAGSSGESFEESLRQQLGIKAQAQKGTIRVLVVDHVERPSAN